MSMAITAMSFIPRSPAALLMMMAATTPPESGGVPVTIALRSVNRGPTYHRRRAIPASPATAMTTVFHSRHSSRTLIMVPMWVMSRYMEIVAIGAPIWARSTMSFGSQPPQ